MNATQFRKHGRLKAESELEAFFSYLRLDDRLNLQETIQRKVGTLELVQLSNLEFRKYKQGD